MVYIYFPASVTKRTKIAPYMDGGLMWDIWSSRSGREGPAMIFNTVSPHAGLESLVHTHAYSTNQIDTDKPNYPVVIFVPSIHGTALNFASIVEDIASHGYIVIAPNLPYISSVVGYPDGRLVVSGSTSAIGDGYFTGNAPLLSILTKDIQFVLDQAANLNTADANFKGHLDLAHVGVFGHHQGGQISISAISNDPRIKAGAALVDTTTASPGNKPFLFVGASFLGASVPAQLAQDQYELSVDGTEVANYSDFGFLVPLIPEMKPAGPQPHEVLGAIDPARGAQIVDSYLVAFFDHYLKGADLKWATYPEAHLSSSGG
jgi:hypothetical protein